MRSEADNARVCLDRASEERSGSPEETYWIAEAQARATLAVAAAIEQAGREIVAAIDRVRMGSS